MGQKGEGSEGGLWAAAVLSSTAHSPPWAHLPPLWPLWMQMLAAEAAHTRVGGDSLYERGLAKLRLNNLISPASPSERDQPSSVRSSESRPAGWFGGQGFAQIGWRMEWQDTPRGEQQGGKEEYMRYERLRVLGRGVHGAAVLLRHRRRGDMVVSKELSLSRFRQDEFSSIQNEVQILASLSHPHIISYLCSYPIEEQHLICIIMEYAEGGNLADVIAEHAGRQEPFAQSLVRPSSCRAACGPEICGRVTQRAQPLSLPAPFHQFLSLSPCSSPFAA